MKFGTIIENEEPVAIVRGSDGRARRLADVAEVAGLSRLGNMLELVTQYGKVQNILGELAFAADTVDGIALDGADWAPPLPNPSKILGVAFNNRELMKKAHRDPGVPNFFLKPPSALQGHGKPIIVDPDWGAVIPEPEICAVIGKRAKHITVEEALDYVFGYLIHNDVTSHGLKFQKDSIAVTYDKDMARPEFYTWRNLNGPDDTDAFYVYHTRSKGTDTFGPMGPWITTKDDVPDPNDLTVVGTLDDEVFTRDHTGNYRFRVEECIAEASRYFTLEPGDMISFGTTGKGAGRFKRGHKSLLIGEETGTIGIAIEPLGTLRNPIKHQKGGA
ncbi:fumarylacetoacetate hydrolase family protein [Hoeflea sp. TYP-13]|uniref:fumarylacetoacetate hydrolase family protein n=1 Tax=Hoeflea sp. TYP-13 TaxID=3230023 RepID=UPI0034C66679